MKTISWCLALAGLLAGRGIAVWADTNAAPAAAEAAPAPAPAAAPATDQVAEIIRALRTHYVDRDELDDPTLSAASVAGILNALGQGAVLLTPSAHGTNVTGGVAGDHPPAPADAPVARAEIIDPDLGYLHLMNVSATAVVAVDAELSRLVGAKPSGYILDLRYAGGDDYAAAAMIASRFLADGQELFHIKRSGQANQVYRAGAGAGSAPPRVAEAPLLLLVNGHTRGSAETLVGGLRAQDRGIILGSLTAGSAVAWDDVPLQDGRVLRVASAKVVLRPADPKSMIAPNVFPGGIAPDIFVPIEAAVEHEVLFNTATNTTLTVSLQPAITKRRRSEAELVKAFRGEPLELGFPKADEPREDQTEEEIRPVRDVVLQRAVDILKGIRVLLSWQ